MFRRLLFALTTLCACVSALSPGIDYTRASSVVGVNDQAFTSLSALSNDVLDARNAVLKQQLSAGVKEYNTFWAAFELTHSTTDPQACDDGYVRVPSDDSGLTKNGGPYFAYHCYSAGQAELFRNYLRSDAASGLQSGAVIWCTAVPYRDPSCQGQPEAAVQSAPEDPPQGYTAYQQNTVGRQSQLQVAVNIAPDGSMASVQSATDAAGCSCVPTADHYLDFQDFVSFLALNVSSPDAHFTHWVIQNEADSGLWYDVSPRATVTEDVDPAGVDNWINSYIDQLNLAKNALTPTPYPVLVYVSLDKYWGVAPTLAYGTQRVSIGGKNIVDRLINAGPLLEWNWSLAVHPYGDPNSNELGNDPAAYDYSTLNIIADQINAGLSAVGKNGTILMAATEQGMQASLNSDEDRAEWICSAHNWTLATPSLVYSAHNDFQRSPGASDDYSLIVSADPLLGDVENDSIWQAYTSTATTAWGQTSEHYCCRTHSLGCA